MVAKRGLNDRRPCGPCRQLHAITTSDRYPLENLTDFSTNLSGMKLFSKIDVVTAYREKTAVVTPFGLFEFVRMPFGLRNTAQTFQRFMHQVVRGLNFIFAYLDAGVRRLFKKVQLKRFTSN